MSAGNRHLTTRSTDTGTARRSVTNANKNKKAKRLRASARTDCPDADEHKSNGRNKTMTLQFHVGETYSTRRIGDHTMTVDATILARTAKFVTISNKWGDTRRCGIQVHNNTEIIYPEGQHSMCAVIGADDQ